VTNLRVALAQLNPTVGDLSGNSELVLSACRAAAEAGAGLVAFPEMALTGYPIEDLALRASFQQASIDMAEQIAATLATEGLADLCVVLGTLLVSNERPQNGAAVLRGGRVEARYVKHHLPNYGVFDEQRLFESGSQPTVIHVNGVAVSIAICEDIWQPGSPAELAASFGADLLLVINASPFERGKDHKRLELCQVVATRTNTAVAYVNCFGAQDELVFDGGSFVVGPSGDVAARSQRFVDQLLLFDTEESSADTPTRIRQGPSAHELSDLSEVYHALTVGLGDYVRKNGIGSVTVGMSGGIDSALVGALACDALGAENVLGVALPSAYSSDHSVEDAQDSAARTGMAFRIVPIAAMFDAFQSILDLTGLAEENLQARIRGTTLMAISNAEGPLVLATGNKSELAVGYSTIYGDAVGGFAPIKDVPKMLVWELARWRNDEATRAGQTPPIPPRSIDKPPSAELRPGQLDTDSLPDYSELDGIVEQYVEARVSAVELISSGYDPTLARRIIRLTDAAEYKRRQYPPGTKITRLAFGRDRRMPITNRWSEPGVVQG
jgi:NAD+ synthase (glutamine-hydrolysing)